MGPLVAPRRRLESRPAVAAAFDDEPISHDLEPAAQLLDAERQWTFHQTVNRERPRVRAHVRGHNPVVADEMARNRRNLVVKQVRRRLRVQRPVVEHRKPRPSLQWVAPRRPMQSPGNRAGTSDQTARRRPPPRPWAAIPAPFRNRRRCLKSMMGPYSRICSPALFHQRQFFSHTTESIMPSKQQAPALQDRFLLQTTSYVDGAWEAGDARKVLRVSNPATGATIAEVRTANAADTRRAIEAAHRAFGEWRKTTVKERAGRSPALVRIDHRGVRGPGGADDRRAGQDAVRVPR